MSKQNKTKINPFIKLFAKVCSQYSTIHFHIFTLVQFRISHKKKFAQIYK